MALSNVVKAKFGKESNWGAAATPTVLLPFSSFTADPEADEIIDDSTRGDASMDYAVYVGMKRVNIEIESPAWPDEVGYFLHGIMGTSAYASTTHTFSVGSSVPSFTFHDDTSVYNRAYAGCQVSSFSLRFNRAEGMVTMNAKLLGKSASTETVVAIADATAKPFLGWQGTFNVAGAATAQLISGELTWERGQEASPHANNSQDMARLDTGRIRYTGSLVLDGASDLLAKYLAGTREAIVISFTNADSKVLTITSTDTSYLKDQMTRDMGGTAIRYNVGIRGVRNSTDGGPCKVTLTNTRTTVY